MSGDKIWIDTNIALYFLGGDATLATALDQKEIYLSVISEMEVLAYPKISDAEIKDVKTFFSDCTIIELTAPIKERAILIRRTYNLKLPDAIIAASAIEANIPLISADSIFKRITELNFIQYVL